MSTISILGRVQPVYQGVFDASKTYVYLDRVKYNDNLYEALKDVPTGTLPTETDYWAALGIKGEKGEDGKDGVTTITTINIYDDYYARPNLFTLGSGVSNKTIIIPAGTSLKINGSVYTSTTATTLTHTAENGVNVYVYACAPASGTTPTFVLSTNSTVPDGYTATNSRKIGGFHTLCAAVGTISGHSLTGYTAGAILPASVWDLRHRPVADPEGMVYWENGDKWVDIYLASWNGSKLVSTYGAIIADGISSKTFHGELFCEEMSKAKKRLPWRREFMDFAKGSNECTNIRGSNDPDTTGGHTDTASRRMISNIGCEDCCGVMWQWVEDLAEGGAYGAIAKNTYWISGYNWDSSLWDGNSLYNNSVDSQSYGQMHGILRRLLVGGYWDNSSTCGSRSANADNLSSNASLRCGARGVSEPKRNEN